MLPPHELKNKPFTKAVRGYSTTEVDEHIAFIIEKYTELYRANDEMERKLRTALAKVDAYKTEEESIRSALVNAQKASATIVNEATERANVIIRSAKTNCDKTLDEFRVKIRKERATLLALQKMTEDFKEKLFAEYQTHIEQIEALGASGQAPMSEEEYVRMVVASIKEDAASTESEPQQAPENEETAGELTETIPEEPAEEELPESEPEPEPEPVSVPEPNHTLHLPEPDEPIEISEEEAATLLEETEEVEPIDETDEAAEPEEPYAGETAEDNEWIEEIMPEEGSDLIARMEQIAPEPSESEKLGTIFPEGGFAEELDAIAREVQGSAVFEEEEPITEEELSESDEFYDEDGAPMPDAAFFDEDGREYENGESPDYDLDHTSDTIELERIPVVGKDRYRSAGVRDTLRALSKKLREEKDEDDEKEELKDDEIEDEADREFLRMIKSATTNAQKRQQEKEQQKKTRLSTTDEFNLVYGENQKRK